MIKYDSVISARGWKASHDTLLGGSDKGLDQGDACRKKDNNNNGLCCAVESQEGMFVKNIGKELKDCIVKGSPGQN